MRRVGERDRVREPAASLISQRHSSFSASFGGAGGRPGPSGARATEANGPCSFTKLVSSGELLQIQIIEIILLAHDGRARFSSSISVNRGSAVAYSECKTSRMGGPDGATGRGFDAPPPIARRRRPRVRPTQLIQLAREVRIPQRCCLGEANDETTYSTPTGYCNAPCPLRGTRRRSASA